jgi:YVTN family beta-propeller protein
VIEPYSWLGVGAVSLGIGAVALTGGAAVAYADGGSGASASGAPGNSAATAGTHQGAARSGTSANSPQWAGLRRLPRVSTHSTADSVKNDASRKYAERVGSGRNSSSSKNSSGSEAQASLTDPSRSLARVDTGVEPATGSAPDPSVPKVDRPADALLSSAPLPLTVPDPLPRPSGIDTPVIPAANVIGGPTEQSTLRPSAGSLRIRRTTALPTAAVDSSPSVVATIPLANGSWGGAALSPDARRLYVITYSDSQGMVSVIDTATNIVEATVPVGLGYSGAVGSAQIEVSRDGRRLYVSNIADGTVSVIDAVTNSPVATIVMADTGAAAPYRVALSPDGNRLYAVTNFGRVAVIDTATNKVTTRSVNERFLTFSADNSRLYVANTDGTISVIDTATDTVIPTTPGPQRIVGGQVAVNPDATRLYVLNESYSSGEGTVTVIDIATNTQVATIPVGYGGTEMTFSPDGSRLYLPNQRDDTVLVMDTATNALVATIPTGTVFSSTEVTLSPDGRQAYVSPGPSQTITVFDTATFSVTGSIPIPSAAYLLFNPNGSRLYAVTDVYSSSTVGEDVAVYVIDPVGGNYPAWLNAVTDHATTAVNTQVSGNVLSNDFVRVSPSDTVAIGDGATVALITGPSHGVLSLNPDGSYTYTPAHDYVGDDSFSYKVSFDSLSGSATVYVSVKSSSQPGGDGESSPDVKKILEAIMGVGSITNEVTHWIDNLSKTYNLSEVLRGVGLVKGVVGVLDGISKGDVRQALNGVTEILSTPLMGGVALLVESLKLVVSVFWPLSNADEQAFWDFRIKCMFHKSENDLTTGEAQALVNRYSMPAVLLNLPADYSRYNVGSWFGRPSC